MRSYLPGGQLVDWYLHIISPLLLSTHSLQFHDSSFLHCTLQRQDFVGCQWLNVRDVYYANKDVSLCQYHKLTVYKPSCQGNLNCFHNDLWPRAPTNVRKLAANIWSLSFQSRLFVCRSFCISAWLHKTPESILLTLWAGAKEEPIHY